MPCSKVKELLNLGTLKFTNTSMHKTFLISVHLCKKNPCDLIESHFTQRDDKALWVRTIHIFLKWCLCIFFNEKLIVNKYTSTQTNEMIRILFHDLFYSQHDLELVSNFSCLARTENERVSNGINAKPLNRSSL